MIALDFDIINFAGDYRRTFHVALVLRGEYRITHETRTQWSIELGDGFGEWTRVGTQKTLRLAKAFAQLFDDRIATQIA